MSIDTTRAPEGAKTSAHANNNTQRAGNNAARHDKSAATPGQGFANLMSLLAASEVPAEPIGSPLAWPEAAVLPDTSAPLDTKATGALLPDALALSGQPNPATEVTTGLVPDALATGGLVAAQAAAEAAATPLLATTPGSVPPAVLLPAAQSVQPELPMPDADADLSAATAGATPALPLAAPLLTTTPAAAEDDKKPADALNSGLPVALPLPVLPEPPEVAPPAAAAAGLATAAEAVGKQAADKLALARARSANPSEAPGAAVAVEASAPSGNSVAHDVAALLAHRHASQAQTQSQTSTQSQGIGRMQAELRDARLQASASQSASVAGAAEVGRAAATLASLDGAVRPAERQAGRVWPGQAGAGLDGLAGSALADKLGISPTYEVAAASAVVPETQLAETVSYWATHGVQSAELTLEGLGTEPVEVRISVDGDQTQIDFRSNQAEVRQVLESASAQLKALLSGEGLQLSGMSVGTSGRGHAQGDGRQPRPGARQAALPSMEPLAASSLRSANPAVGRGLDLYV